MNLRRLVISAALLAAFGAFMAQVPWEAPEAAAAAQLVSGPAPSR